MKLSMADWDRDVGHHLEMIEAGAEMCERHAKRLLGMPSWETLALDQLKRAEETLRRAREIMEGKPDVS